MTDRTVKRKRQETEYDITNASLVVLIEELQCSKCGEWGFGFIKLNTRIVGGCVKLSARWYNKGHFPKAGPPRKEGSKLSLSAALKELWASFWQAFANVEQQGPDEKNHYDLRHVDVLGDIAAATEKVEKVMLGPR